ncbi:early endosome antigen 1 isoform X1 [Quillaja saponaria]|uniref:Early endosome antigen 1 isoform X1 n=1 Tax=Quillaja saponaria TaxID=32244 RepID=A0AAD7LWQ2_QUISA|nr:early endosome antigen 1 isoform X1 [Quillaja saponaria]
MSRITKWKLEKTKVKVVFRLQFHATHIPQTGWDKLFISFIPADSGKATSKTTKANARNGTCKWADPIYETTRLLQDIKTKQYDEKFYKFVVAMGSSRSSILGEANINLADFAYASKPSDIALPLHGCEAGTTLHVSVQLLTSKTGFREFEQQRELRERGLQLTYDQSIPDEFVDRKFSNTEQDVNNHLYKVNPRVKFKGESKELPSLSSLDEEMGINDECGDSAAGFDGSSNTSGSIYAEKHDTSSMHEVDSLKSAISGDFGGISFNQNPQPEKRDDSDNRFLAQGTTDWVHRWGSDYTTSNDLAAYEENSRLRGSLELAESSILELKLEMSSLQSHADEIGGETQKFSQQLAAEISLGEELAKEVAVLKSQCLKFKDDLAQLKNSKDVMKGTTGFLTSDLQQLIEVLQDLKQGTTGAISGTNLVDEKESKDMVLHKCEQFVTGTMSDSEICQPESMLHPLSSFSIHGVVSHESESIDSTAALKGQNFELLRQLNESKTEQENLAKKMDQMECYYEALVLELEQNQRQMMGELQDLRNEHSTCRAINAEAALKRARLNYSIAVDQLQKDLELLSCQVLSVYETNENLIKQVFSNSSLPSPETEKNQKLVSEESHTASLLQCQNQTAGVKKPHFGGNILLKDLKRSVHLQEGLYRKVEEEVCEMHLVNIYLDVFSKALQETLIEASADSRLMKGKVDQLSQQVDISTKSKELLMLRLQNAMDDIVSLNEYKATYIAKSNDIALRNQILEENFENLAHENRLLTQKVNELEALTAEYRSQETFLKEELQAVRTEVDELAFAKDNLLSIVNLLSDKLQNLLALYDTKYSDLSLTTKSSCQDLQSKDLAGLVLQLEDLQRNACERILLLMEEKKILIHDRQMAQVSLNTAESDILIVKQKLEHDLREMINNIGTSSALVQKLKVEFEAVVDSLRASSGAEELYMQQHKELLSGLDSFEAKLQQLISRSEELTDEILALETLSRELETCKLTIAAVTEEKETLMMSIQENTRESSRSDLDLNCLRENLLSLNEQLESERSLREKLERDVTDLSSQLNEKHSLLQDFHQQKTEVVHSQATGVRPRIRKNKMVADVSLTFTRSQYGDYIQELVEQLRSKDMQLETCKLTIIAITEGKEFLMMSLQEKTEESGRIQSELNSLKENLHYLQDELQVERSLREKLKNEVTDLTIQINEKHSLLQDFDQQQTELVRLKQLVSDLESEKSRVSHLLLHSEKHLEAVLRESSSITCLETQLSEMHETSMAADVSLTFTSTQYGACIDELVKHLRSTEMQLDVLHKKNLDVQTELHSCLAREAHCIEDNSKLLKNLDSLKSDLEASTATNKALIDQYSATRAEFNEYMNRTENMETTFCMQERKHALEVERLENLLASSYGEIEDLVLSKEGSEVKFLVLKEKLVELHAAMISLKQHDDKLIMLQNQCNELTKRLSEQVLKTEEFKNLSIHLKELKDKADADAESLNACEKRGPEGPPVAMQESLRIVFIREQYETKLKELRDHLSVSKKHSEEMLWKLQDAIDEIENRKKSEASQIKKNEELGKKVLELETELRFTLSEKRELINAYDRMKAEKECSLITLECCKEEQQELEAALQKCNQEKSKIGVELNLTKELMESSRSHLSEHNDAFQKMGCMTDEPLVMKLQERVPISGTPSVGSEIKDMIPANCPFVAPFSDSMNHREAKPACSVLSEGHDDSHVHLYKQPEKDVVLSRGVNGIKTHEDLQCNDQRRMALTKSLKYSMDHLNKELERMKNENLLRPVDDPDYELSFPGLQRELMLLHEANEDLGNKFPLFNEISVSGNALERVLALEIELAEALQAKKKASIHFQSSFLKQHSDEEAIFQSFRDINELIKDMLEIKARHVAVETELKDMHDRYSQLSLQFAEVEGERQKLMMTLRNIRASKVLHPSASIRDHSP